MTLMAAPRPQRRATDHVHPEYWEEGEQHRYEDRITAELQGIRREIARGSNKVDALNTRITFLMGAVAILAFAIPIFAPFIRAFLNLP